MRRFALLVIGLALAPVFVSAAVIEGPVFKGTAFAPVPALPLSMSGPVSASFGVALTPTLLTPSLSAPAPALIAAPTPLVAELKPVAAAYALTVRPLSAPSAQPNVRGPPTAKDAAYPAFVAKSVADKTVEWKVPAAEILDDHDAILVGENHHSLASVNELARALPGLAKAGVSVLGIEGLKRPNQKAVDAYVSGRTAVLPAEVLSFSPLRRTAFEGLLKSARETGVRVIALGMPLKDWAQQAAELAAEKTGDPMETFLAEPGDQLYRAQTGYEPGYNEAVAEVYLTRRNQSMAQFLSEAMIKGAKAIVLVGQNHVESADGLPFKFLGKPNWGTMPSELARLGLKAFSLTLTGGIYTDAQAAKDDREVRRASYAQAADISDGGRAAFSMTGASQGLYHAGGTVSAVATSRARH